jgi:pimeloyl-ACP methyl ester carboxylesterase
MLTVASHDGARLHYDIQGGHTDSRDPIVVLAGGAARRPDYLGDLAGLDSVRSLLILHQRGVGGSASPDMPLAAWPDLAHDVQSLREHLGGSPIDVLGHSAGTRVALAYAAANPDGVNRMCLVTPSALYLVDADDDREAMIQRRRTNPGSVPTSVRAQRSGQPNPFKSIGRSLT